MHIEDRLIRSETFRSLGRNSMLVYFDFLRKRKMHRMKAKKGRDDAWVVKNNGEIVFTYKEAEGRGLRRDSFRNAIDELVIKGFIDIAHQGSGGNKRDVSLYSISDRWMQYGTPEFIEHERVRDTRRDRGWMAIQKRKQSKILSTENRTS